MSGYFGTQEVKAVAQQVFDVVATHLFTQGKQAREGGNCQYRTKAGLKCAVGALITDESWEKLRQQNFTNGGPVGILQLLPEAFEPIIPAAMATDKRMLELLAALQRLHDSEAYAVFHNTRWKHRLYFIAANFELSIANVPQLVRFRKKNQVVARSLNRSR